MQQITFKKTVRRLVIELLIVIGLVGFGENVPSHLSLSAAWKFVVHHPNLLLHVLVGTVTLAESITLLVRALRGVNRSWKLYAAIGLFFVLCAYGSGELFVAKQRESLLTDMSLGWLGALITYSIAWAKHRQKRAK